MPPVDPTSFRPMWLQVVDHLRQLINEGRLRPGDQLPGHEELAASFQVSPGTIRRALGVLAAEELVSSKQGMRTEVAHQRERSMTQLRPGDRLRYRPATPDEQREYGLVQGADVAEVVRTDGSVEVFHPRAVEFLVADSEP